MGTNKLEVLRRALEGELKKRKLKFLKKRLDKISVEGIVRSVREGREGGW